MRFIYTIGIRLYSFSIRIASLFNSRARLWIKGRRNWKAKLEQAFPEPGRTWWFHCASLGEFEQGRPLIEAIRKREPGVRILLTFFSPSGYEVRKNYEHADHIMYLPADTPSNVKYFLDTVKPDAALIIKYEFWFNYLAGLQQRGIRHYLVSGIFRNGQYFFRPSGRHFLKYLKGFSHFFVQDKESEELLRENDITNVTVSGDTRFDRVYEISRSSSEQEKVKNFCNKNKVIIAGSSWPAEEEMICRFINESPGDELWIIAPHEIGDDHIGAIGNKLTVPFIKYSEYDPGTSDIYRVMIIDNIGLLSSIYRYGDLAIIGGGFGRGIHNILEPASWGLPVIFGPNHHKFREAKEMLTTGGAFTFKDYSEFESLISKLGREKASLSKASERASGYVRSKLGATEIVIDKLL